MITGMENDVPAAAGLAKEIVLDGVFCSDVESRSWTELAASSKRAAVARLAPWVSITSRRRASSWTGERVANAPNKKESPSSAAEAGRLIASTKTGRVAQRFRKKERGRGIYCILYEC